MKQIFKNIILYITLFLIPGGVFAYGEKNLILGGVAGWEAAEKREGIAEVGSVRPNPVLVLSSARDDAAGLDMALSFDEGRPDLFTDRTGHYRTAVSAAAASTDMRWARAGMGAVHFFGSAMPVVQAGLRDPEPLVITPHSREAILAPESRIRDFTLEFWLYPMNMENGEQILTWTSTRLTRRGEPIYQRIQCMAMKNRLQWTFLDFFTAPDESRQLTFSPKGSSPVAPQTWSHHLIRFDAGTGLLEYLVDGIPEDILYVTSTGHEGGEVYTPRIGEEGRLVLGGRFSGLMDEFRLYGAFVDQPLLKKYSGREGRMETRILDLGEGDSRILRVDAFGGRTSYAGRIREPAVSGTSGGALVSARGGAAILATPANEYSGSGSFNFADDSAIRFFIRTGDAPYLGSAAWRSFEPGTELDIGLKGNGLRGRFIQLAAEFYPSGDGETTPYLEELRITYAADEPPRPPALVTAVARDGAVDLSWRPSPDRDVEGYLVYYGTNQGEYFGEGAAPGSSPVNVGKRTSIHIDGLRNGVLYYFAVSAYDRVNASHAGGFSREATARPQRSPDD
ncbi:MAG: fibronectin type III domain-containing protein [Treponema sp.]|jgi:hypothetical protein|nr:fibronectin type III domain-containing protein [Treponema sp.]